MTYRAFKGNNNYYNTKISKTIEANLVEFINWGFVNQGAFTNVTLDQAGAYGGDWSRLRRVDDPRYTDGTVYEGIRGNWVWESGLDSSTSPIAISGIYVDGVLTTTGYNVDYINGRVIFDTAPNSSASIQAEYSFKEVKVFANSEHPILKTVQELSRRPDNTNFLANSGLYVGLRDAKIEPPCIGVEVSARSNGGYQLGTGQIVKNTIKCYVLGENDYWVNQIADTLSDQESKNIRLFDLDLMAENDAFPLTYQGYIAPSALTYPDLVQPTGIGGYLNTSKIQYGKTRISKSTTQDGNWISNNLYQNTVTMITESIVLNI